MIGLTEAQRLTNKSRTALVKAIASGKLSAKKDEATGQWRLDVAELGRLYQLKPVTWGDSEPSPSDSVAPSGVTPKDKGLEERIRNLESSLAEVREERNWLRSQLEEAGRERVRLMALLPAPQIPTLTRSRTWAWAWISTGLLLIGLAGVGVWIVLKG